MAHTKQRGRHWLVSDVGRATALIKFDIKQQESLLKSYLADGAVIIDKTVMVCASLSQCYGDYLHALSVGEPGDVSFENSRLDNKTVDTCYKYIQLLKQQFNEALTIEASVRCVSDLRRQYQHLGSLLKQNASESLKKTDDTAYSRAITPLLRAHTPTDWLYAVVQFANQSEASLIDYLTHMATLENQQLLHLSHAFNQQGHVHLMSAVFFYKLFPQRLFQTALHPEKLVSVKSRLSLLYEVVEMLHQTLVQLLAQRGLHPMPDYLFHGEELPHGIEIVIDDDSREAIQSAIKSWRMNTKHINDCQPGMNHLDDMVRAYKFWFNPNRLIDAVMLLKQKISVSGAELVSDNTFYQQMQAVYCQLTTTECLDLYGYFANKDSCYLMRTLLVISEGHTLSWLPSLSQAEKSAIIHVYNALECVMNALRAELAARQISTAPYKRTLPARKITPGRRNRNAVTHIITLYSKQAVTMNTKLEQLFNAIEAGE